MRVSAVGGFARVRTRPFCLGDKRRRQSAFRGIRVRVKADERGMADKSAVRNFGKAHFAYQVGPAEVGIAANLPVGRIGAQKRRVCVRARCQFAIELSQHFVVETGSHFPDVAKAILLVPKTE